MASKILMLDVDGVLNSKYSRIAADLQKAGDSLTFREWLPSAVGQLKRIINETGCEIVISSDWRRPHQIPYLKEGFFFFGIKPWIGITPSLGYVPGPYYRYEVRGQEINAWLEQFRLDGGTIESYAIVDDHNWMLLDQSSNFVQTNDDVGLLAADADRIIRILNNVN